MDPSALLITVTRTVTTGSISILETASAPVPAAPTVPAGLGEAVRAGYVAAALFAALPSVKPTAPFEHGKN